MPTIFLSYRRTDGPQACRIYNWLAQRFGNDEVFMDVNAIPFAESFPDFIRDAIGRSKVMVTLIGADWLKKLAQPDDPVRMEIETAVERKIPLLPVTIGSTPMPPAESLPPSIASLANQNALPVGVLMDFDTHMRSILPKIESIIGRLTAETRTTENPEMIRLTCEGIISFLRERFFKASVSNDFYAEWKIFGTASFSTVQQQTFVTLYLHRIVALGELLELHFILSFWSTFPHHEHLLSGWVLYELQRTPLIPDSFIVEVPGASGGVTPVPLGRNVKIRRSDEDARQIWRMITDQPLRLSLAYIATISPAEATPQTLDPTSPARP